MHAMPSAKPAQAEQGQASCVLREPGVDRATVRARDRQGRVGQFQGLLVVAHRCADVAQCPQHARLERAHPQLADDLQRPHAVLVRAGVVGQVVRRQRQVVLRPRFALPRAQFALDRQYPFQVVPRLGVLPHHAVDHAESTEDARLARPVAAVPRGFQCHAEHRTPVVQPRARPEVTLQQPGELPADVVAPPAAAPGAPRRSGCRPLRRTSRARRGTRRTPSRRDR